MNPISKTPIPPRHDRLVQERIHDPYQATRKLPEPTVCPDCRAVYQRGHWGWAPFWPMDSHQEFCPACRRTRDDYPGGVVTLAGAFALAHRDEMLHLVHRHAAREKAEHPLHRIMAVEENGAAIVIKTTDVHLPRRLGDAIHHAFKGRTEIHYDDEGCFARVNWRRED